MTELAFGTNAYTRHSLLDALHRIADHGYAGVELLADAPHAYIPDFDDDDRLALADALASADLAVSNVNANTAMGYYSDAPPSPFFDPSLVTADDADRTWRIEYTKGAIDLAAAVDAQAVCVAPGRPLPGNPPERAREYLFDSLHELLDYAEPRDVDLGIEFEPGHLIECTDEVLSVIDEVGRDSLGVNLDLGHAAVYGEDPAESVRRCAGLITGLHLEDIAGGIRGKHYHLIPGEGDLDFESVFDALDDVGYEGFATLELYTYPDEPDHAARASYEALERYVA